MGHAAITLAIFGFAVGTVFRLKILLAVLALLLVASVAFAISRGSSLPETALIIMAAQSIAQGSYFLGLVARAVLAAACRFRMRPIL